VEEIAMTLAATIEDFLQREIDVGTFPGCVYAVGSGEGFEYEGALGNAVVVGARIPMRPETLFDAASLTKPLITSTLALMAVADGAIALDGRVVEIVPELRGTDKEEITLRQLLTHSAGFEAWFPLYTTGSDRASYLETIVSRPLAHPPGSQVIYSDLGFILLHMALERLYGRDARDVARERIFAPLSIGDATLNPAASDIPRIAATEWGQRVEQRMCIDRGIEFDHFRDRLMWGDVNDGNSWGLGGYAGNAGLFATARAVFRIASTYIVGGSPLLPAEVISEAVANQTAGNEENRGLGWQIRSDATTSISSPLSRRAFGHTGFTGTSVWLDPELDRIIVLMTNRIHPSAASVGMQNARRELNRIVAGL
jgi:CubicO group peptidase (beta-lactamase class C family)